MMGRNSAAWTKQFSVAGLFAFGVAKSSFSITQDGSNNMASSGRISAFGASLPCLDVLDRGNKKYINIRLSNTDCSEFAYNSTTQQIQLQGSSKCWSATTRVQNVYSSLYLAECDTTKTRQQFSFDESEGLVFASVGQGELCLTSVRRNVKMPAKLKLGPCPHTNWGEEDDPQSDFLDEYHVIRPRGKTDACITAKKRKDGVIIDFDHTCSKPNNLQKWRHDTESGLIRLKALNKTHGGVSDELPGYFCMSGDLHPGKPQKMRLEVCDESDQKQQFDFDFATGLIQNRHDKTENDIDFCVQTMGKAEILVYGMCQVSSFGISDDDRLDVVTTVFETTTTTLATTTSTTTTEAPTTTTTTPTTTTTTTTTTPTTTTTTTTPTTTTTTTTPTTTTTTPTTTTTTTTPTTTTPTTTTTTTPTTTTTTTPTTTTTTTTPTTTTTTTTPTTTTTTTVSTTTTTATTTAENFADAQVWGETCGARPFHDRLVGGKTELVRDAPWSGIVNINHDNQNRGTICGQVMISSFHSLTSAQCTFEIDLSKARAVFGLHKLNLDGVMTASYVYDIADATTHPSYNPEVLTNDIGILTMAREIVINNNVGPICLPRNDMCLEEGTEVTINGWGSSSSDGTEFDQQHRMANVNITDSATCSGFHATFDPSVQTCAFDVTDQAASCVGDEGGALTHYELNADGHRVYTLYALASWNTMPCGSDPVVYTRITEYLDFIQSNTAVRPNSPLDATDSCREDTTVGTKPAGVIGGAEIVFNSEDVVSTNQEDAFVESGEVEGAQVEGVPTV